MLFGSLNDVPLTEDATDGWSYDADAHALVLHGEARDRLRRGDVRRIAVGFGCAPVDCEPRPEVCNGLDEDCDDAIGEGCLM